MAVTSNRERLLQPNPIRAIYLVLGGASYLLTELFRIRLRPIFKSLEINDFGFSDSIGNCGGIIVQIFLSFALINPTRTQSYRLAAFFAGGYILYEFAQPYLPKGTFDWNDVFATVIGYTISMLILWLVWKKFTPPEIRDGQQKP